MCKSSSPRRFDADDLRAECDPAVDIPAEEQFDDDAIAEFVAKPLDHERIGAASRARRLHDPRFFRCQLIEHASSTLLGFFDGNAMHCVFPREPFSLDQLQYTLFE